MEEILRSSGLEQHHLVHTSEVDESDHSQSKSRCSLLHQNEKFCKINQNSSIIPGLNAMPSKKSNKIWNIVHIPSRKVLICDECGTKFGSESTLNRHKTYQHASYKLICPECNYATTWKDNIRRHLINTHKLKKVGTIIDNLQRIQTEQKNAKVRAQAPPSAPNPNHSNNELKQLKMKGTIPYIYAKTLPKNKKVYSWTLEELVCNPTKKFTMDPVNIPPKCNGCITPQPVKQLDETPIHIDDALADLGWLPEALHPDSKQDKQINTPILSCTPTQEWITIDQLGSPENIDYDIQTF